MEKTIYLVVGQYGNYQNKLSWNDNSYMTKEQAEKRIDFLKKSLDKEIDLFYLRQDITDKLKSIIEDLSGVTYETNEIYNDIETNFDKWLELSNSHHLLDSYSDDEINLMWYHSKWFYGTEETNFIIEEITLITDN